MTDQSADPLGDDTPDLVAASNGHTLVLDAGLPRGYDDDDLTTAELADEAGWQDAGEVPAGIENELAAMGARVEALAQAAAMREGRRIRRKVLASAAGAALASAAPAILQAVDALNLPPALQPFSIALTGVIGAFIAGYVAPERDVPDL